MDKLFFAGVLYGVETLINTDKTNKDFTPSNLKVSKCWKSQEKCRSIFNSLLYPHCFVSVRPDWLSNPLTGSNLELDGYCEQLKLAFEYDGVQHHKYTKKFHKSETDFQYQQEKDRWKDSRCKELGIILIRIPYNITDLNTYIYQQLKQYGYIQ